MGLGSILAVGGQYAGATTTMGGGPDASPEGTLHGDVAIPDVGGTSTPTGTPTATDAPEMAETPSATETPTASPSQTPTDTPTAMPDQDQTVETADECYGETGAIAVFGNASPDDPITVTATDETGTVVGEVVLETEADSNEITGIPNGTYHLSAQRSDGESVPVTQETVTVECESVP